MLAFNTSRLFDRAYSMYALHLETFLEHIKMVIQPRAACMWTLLSLDLWELQLILTLLVGLYLVI